VKRLIVLLIVLAGGLAAAAFAVPSNAALVNGVSITQQQLNSDLTAIAGSPDYQCFINAEEAVGTGGQSALPSVDGAGPIVGGGSHPTVTTGFAGYYLNTVIGHQLVFELAARQHLRLTPQDLATARTELNGQMTAILSDVASSKYACGSGTTALTAKEVLDTMPASFVDTSVKFDATVSLMEEDAAGVGPSSAALQRYFANHAAEFDTACFTVAEYASQTDAEAAVAQVAAGTPFSTVALATQGGGPQGCDILYGVAASLPSGTNLESLAPNAVSSPIAENGDYLLVQITSRSPTSFAKAQTEVESAVQSAGASKTGKAIDAAEKAANISVDARYGKWSAADSHVFPPSVPATADVLNSSANGTRTKTATATATASTGQSS
jgi:hypothetical protein